MRHVAFRHLVIATLGTAVVLLGAAGCSSSNAPKSSVDYRDNRALPTLIVPPDLTSPNESENLEVPGMEIGKASMKASAAQVGDITNLTVLPEVENLRIRSSGDLRWLQVKGDIDELYVAVTEFWGDQGFSIAVNNPSLGRMETDWAESEAGIEPKWAVSRWLNKWGQSDYRDRFSAWMERADEPGYVNIYLAHFGLERAFVDPDVNPEANTTLNWQTRPSDRSLESEMLVRLAAYLGVADQQARQMLAESEQEATLARIMLDDRQSSPYLQINQPFNKAWARTVNTLDRYGLEIANIDKEQGSIRVGGVKSDVPLRGSDNPLTKVDFGGKRSPKYYYLNLAGISSDVTRLDVVDSGDQATTESSRRLLQFMEQQLR